jgi:hypothetical protein
MSKLKMCIALIQQSSVFSRLGEKSQVSSTSNQDRLEDKHFLEDMPASRESVLPYAGVFKQEPRKKIVKKFQIQESKNIFKNMAYYTKNTLGFKKIFLQDGDQIIT